MPYFFREGVKLDAGREVLLAPEDWRHACRVLRLRPGDAVVVADGSGSAFAGVIVAADPGEVRVLLKEPVPPSESPLEIVLLHALSKGEKMDLIVRQAVELGAARVIPVNTERSIPRLSPERVGNRLMRWRNIARAAAGQCRRAAIPRVEELIDFADTLKLLEGKFALVPWEKENRYSILEIAKRQPASREGAVFVFIGPEGGFSRSEIEALRKAGAVPVHLGPRILRTETAAAVALALVQALWGDMGPAARWVE